MASPHPKDQPPRRRFFFIFPLVLIFPLVIFGGRMQHVRPVDAVALIGVGMLLGVCLMQLFRR
jgi:hypothetical protein